jgi:hypothetical protein
VVPGASLIDLLGEAWYYLGRLDHTAEHAAMTRKTRTKQ